MVWASARIAGRRARSAETLLAARALEADARPWGRTMAVLSLAVAIGSGTGWIEAGIMDQRHTLDPFWLTSFTLVNLALLVAMAAAAAALLVHQAEYLMEHGPVLANLRATGVADGRLRRVLARQGIIAAVLPCCIAALIGFVGLADTGALYNDTWALWPVTNAVLMTALGLLAATLTTRASRRRLGRAVSPAAYARNDQRTGRRPRATREVSVIVPFSTCRLCAVPLQIKLYCAGRRRPWRG